MLKPTVTPHEQILLNRFILEETGIVLDESKVYLLESRLGPILEKEGCKTYSQLLQAAKSEKKNRLKQLIIDAISTNETSFFRDIHPFNLLAHKLVPEHFDKENRRLDIWSCAASTGQEVYSIAIILKEILHHLDRYQINILGTDISDAALEVASAGKYTSLQLSRGLSKQRQNRFFTKQGDLFKISDELRALVTFKKVNLLKPFYLNNTFDIVFCRNIAVYFTTDSRRVLFNAIADKLKETGALIIGATEALTGITNRFIRNEFHSAVYYKKK
ncbi:MAG: protein-glutamate O-methyltransferase CheR [Proteobacteria bacterium]|nr:protein-glutamate O-methyltransferase CheR [Pseudomonadota bacterium]